MHTLISVVASACILMSMWQLGQRQRYGFIWAMFGQTAWTAYAVLTNQLVQLGPMSVILFILSVRGFLKWSERSSGRSAPLSTATTLNGASTSMPGLASAGSAVGSIGSQTFPETYLSLAEPVVQDIQDQDMRLAGRVINLGQQAWEVYPIYGQKFLVWGNRDRLLEAINQHREEFTWQRK